MEKPRGWDGLSGRDDQSRRRGWSETWPRAIMCHPRAGAWWLPWREKPTRMGYLMPEIFPSMVRLGRGDSKGGVIGRKQCCQKNFPTVEVI